MRISERQVGDAAVLDLAGRIAGRKVDEIGAAVSRHVQAGTRLVVANLSGVPSVDLAGLGALVEAQRAARAAGCDLRLAGVNHRIHDLVILTRLVTVFDTFDSVDAAAGGAVPSYEGVTAQNPAMSLGRVERFLHRA
jgi:anti-sigma B factor antagonist